MVAPELIRMTSHGVTLLGDRNRPGGVTLAFTERCGGVSKGGYSSLNLSDGCGDDEACVAENRRRALAALGAQALADGLVCPRQVHGSKVLTIAEGALTPAEGRAAAREGADAIVCATKDVAVLLCFADCVPVVLAAPGAFAVIHSGWRGTRARIAAKALRALMDAASCTAKDVVGYIGPHIGVEDYEVSAELAASFAEDFGGEVVAGERQLDLGLAVEMALVEAGMDRASVACVEESTASTTERFFSYRAQNGNCGRHGALACMLSNERGEVR
ncbi:MAG: polyphenol oxidase family protein [Coriobacteriales bacterium]|nr:polyphenol oxidase family protein [Coriobacteriales bacterium]